jgi:cobalt-zinc-cadmium efflux system protein
VGGLSWEAIQRFSEPVPVAGKTVMVVAACGIVLNGFCAWLFSSGSKGDLNIRGAFVHMVADALVSLGVVASGFVILLTGWHWLDPAVSLVINAVIVWSTWGLLTGSLAMALNAVPTGIETAKVETYLKGLPGVSEVHDLHIWSMSTTETALTVHLVHPSGLDDISWPTPHANWSAALKFSMRRSRWKPERSNVSSRPLTSSDVHTSDLRPTNRPLPAARHGIVEP